MAGQSADKNSAGSPGGDKSLSESEKVFKEFLSRQESGEEVDAEEYLRLYPDLKMELEKFFAQIRVRRPVEIDLDNLGETEDDDESPRILGDFRVIRKIGSGGMASVYEAEQISLKRRVALKILPSHLSYSDEAVVKFRREAEAAGRQSHPGIVSVFAVGKEKGVHYIAQELVDDGRTLADWLEDVRQGGAPPIGYFREVAGIVRELAGAFQFAHDTGVIHRDIKPTNILLSGDDRPKVTDFGLAKVEGALALSRTGDFAGTPYYMSPEQAMSRRIGIDHKTDIFSLGVTFYELLTLERPFQGETSQEVLRKIVLIDPRNPRKVNPRVPNDLAVICIKAMEKRPESRYATMTEFGEDIERFLQGETILARPAGFAKKFVRRLQRNPLVSGAVGVALLSLLALVLYMLWSYPQLVASEKKAREECAKRAASERKALEERDKAEAINQFMLGFFSLPYPGLDGRDVRVVDALERAVLDIDISFFDKPDINASLRHTIGKILHSLGRFNEAEPLLRAALEASIRRRGANDETTLERQGNLAAALLHLGRYDEAEKLCREAVAAWLRLESKNNPAAALRTQNLLGDILLNRGRFDEAGKLLIETLEAQIRIKGEDDRDTISTMNSLALSFESRNRLADAAACYRKCFDASTRIHGEEQIVTLLAKANLAFVLGKMGQYDEAETMLLETLEGQERLLGTTHAQTIITMNNLAFLYQAQGRFAAAEALFARALEAHGREHGDEENQRTLTLRANLAAMHAKQDRPVEGERLFREALEGRRRLLGDNHPDTIVTLFSLGNLLCDQGKFSEAEPLLLEALEHLEGRPDDGSGLIERTRALLVELYEEWGKPDKAAEYADPAAPENDR